MAQESRSNETTSNICVLLQEIKKSGFVEEVCSCSPVGFWYKCNLSLLSLGAWSFQWVQPRSSAK
jgi:hypothetical protein